MRNLRLQVTTQGVSGGKNKTETKGWAALSFSQEGQTLGQISVDTFEGSGQTYKERSFPLITISFHDGESPVWSGGINELRERLK